MSRRSVCDTERAVRYPRKCVLDPNDLGRIALLGALMPPISDLGTAVEPAGVAVGDDAERDLDSGIGQFATVRPR
jgi:hypothetical protein